MNRSGVFTTPEGIVYRDRKRSLWVASLLVPSVAYLGPALYFASGLAWVLWLPLVFYYATVPVLDILIGEDRSNPPEAVVPQLEADPYYRYVTYALVPMIWGAYLFGIWFVGTQNLPAHGVVAMILLVGGTCGVGINVGHELGHKQTRLERWLAKLVLAPCVYGHFFIEHNRGHHRDVATPKDPASSRMGESIWKFVCREMPGAARRAWRIESERLARAGHRTGSWHNEILQPGLLTLALWLGAVALFGPAILVFLVGVAFWGAFQLTSANYIEHYGLLRQKLPNGRYERTQPHHSWNSNHMFSNWATFHLQRHSDHHAHPTRRYQSLRHFDDLPNLPNGYFGMFLVAYIPPLWYAVMNKRLLEQVDYDPARINFDPARRSRLIAKYGLKTGSSEPA